ALADEAAMQGELQLIIGRLEDFAAKLHDGLEAADWTSQRDLIRALVKRVEVARGNVNIVFRIDSYQGDNRPERTSLQLCRGRGVTLAGQYRPAWPGRRPPPQSPPPQPWPRLASNGYSLCRRYGHSAPRRGDASGPPHEDRNMAPTRRLTVKT